MGKGNGGNRRTVENTKETTERNPAGFLGEALVRGSVNDTIEAQEASGQKQLVSSDVLPTEFLRDQGQGRAILESFGVKFLGVVPGDPLFQYVELPPGWKKEPTDHSMWSLLKDDKGRRRGGIFYKAAFYDRKAHIELDSRYSCRQDYGASEKGKVVVYLVMEGDMVIWRTQPKLIKEKMDSWKLADEACKEAEAWLNQHYPDWKNPGAYWD